jgi:hypothetical protein
MQTVTMNQMAIGKKIPNSKNDGILTSPVSYNERKATQFTMTNTVLR